MKAETPDTVKRQTYRGTAAALDPSGAPCGRELPLQARRNPPPYHPLLHIPDTIP